MLRRALLAALAVVLAGPALAEAPDSSLRPPSKPGAAVNTVAEQIPAASAPAEPARSVPALRPERRPVAEAASPAEAEAATEAAADTAAETGTEAAADTAAETATEIATEPAPELAADPATETAPVAGETSELAAAASPRPEPRPTPPARPTTTAEPEPEPAQAQRPPAVAAMAAGATRPQSGAAPLLGALGRGSSASPAPEPTPVDEIDGVTTGGAPVVATSAAAAAATPRPPERPSGLGRLFQRAAQPAPNYSRQGSVCGERAIRGTAIAAIDGKGACGIPQPVRITEVSGVKLSQAATVDCNTARALMTWIETGAKPAVGKRGGGVVGLQVAAHYACRNRNNRPGGRLSEHAKGKAIDISAIQLADGSAMTVLRGWRDGTQGPILRRMHKSACGPFGTVLGPNSDRYHQDHFHFDTASYRSGPYCR